MMRLLARMATMMTTTMRMMVIMTTITPASAYNVTTDVHSSFTEIPASLPPFVLFESGAPVMVEGDPLQMSCPEISSLNRYDWHYRNRSTGEVRIIWYSRVMPRRNATLEDSGQYNCTATDVSGKTFYTDLTVLERLSQPLVVARPQVSMVLEGSGLITLKCVTTSGPSPVSWRWYRLGRGDSQEVRTGQELTLSRTGESGEYQCLTNTSTLGLVQAHRSLPHHVYIIPSPDLSAAGLPVGIAALVLVLLCLSLLLLLAAWLFMYSEKKPSALNEQADGTPPNGYPVPGKELKDDSTPAGDEVYMNCESPEESYTNLDLTDISGEDTYDCLS